MDQKRPANLNGFIHFFLNNKTPDHAKANLPELANIDQLLAQYKAKVFERHAHLFK